MTQMVVSAGLAEVDRRLTRAAERAGRARSAVTLVAVSKAVDTEAVRQARAAGQSDFGESRAQELRRKAEAIGPGVRWHFIGRIQRNKVRDVVGVAGLIHSVDRVDVARAVAQRAVADDHVQQVLVQVNAGNDPAKGGCTVDGTADLVAAVRRLPGIACQGLMTVPPMGVDPRPVFASLRALRDDLRAQFPEISHLSMGMSHDFEAAVEEGATIVRIGEAVFGPRPAPPEPQS